LFFVANFVKILSKCVSEQDIENVFFNRKQGVSCFDSSYICGNIATMRQFKAVTLFVLGIIFFVSSTSIAQSGEGEIENQQVIVEKNKKIELPTSQRDFEKIVIEKKTIDVSKQHYLFNDYNLPLPYLDAKLKILSIKEEPLAKLYPNYVKAGFGNYVTPYFEAFLYNKRSDKYAYGLNARHFSSARGPVKNSGLSDNHLVLYGQYYAAKHTLRSELGYYRTARQFYGYNQDLEVGKDTMKQVFNNFLLNLDLKNNDTTAKMTYQANLELSQLSDRFQAKEAEALLRYKTQMILDEVSRAGVRGLVSVAGRSDSTQFIRNLVSLQPYYLRKIGKLSLAGGINFAYENDTLYSKKNFHLYPSLKAEYKIIEGVLGVYGGFDGNIERNTLRSTLRENPWMTNRFVLSHANKLIELYAGAQGNIFKKFTYQFQGSYLNYKNLPFLVNNGADSLRFALAYDSNKVQITRFKFDLSYNLDNKLLAGVAFTYQSFQMGTLKQPWHMPTMQANYHLSYFMKEKVVFSLNSYMLQGIQALEPNGKVKKLPTILDLNLKVDYLFSQNFSAFLELNNLLANKYQRYLYYSQKGINFLVGATCSF
jgi:hypothetical protein